MFDEKLDVFPVQVELIPGPSPEIVWEWGKDRFVKPVAYPVLGRLQRQAAKIARQMRAGRQVHKELRQMGREMGRELIGAEIADKLFVSLSRRTASFSLILIRADCPDLVDLPWEAIIFPGLGLPLFAHHRVRGNLEFARLHKAFESGKYRERLKGLVVSANSLERPLNVERQIEELSRRFQHHPQILARSFVNPGLAELELALRRECTLFLFAGHGKFSDRVYFIELNEDYIDMRALLESLKQSGVQTLIFDSCESSYGGTRGGLPALLQNLPNATCLLGIQGPGIDSVSCWHMPGVVDRIMVGQPVWTAVNGMRLLLFDQDADTWFLPVMHLKPTYAPSYAPDIEARSDYLDLISQKVKERQLRFALLSRFSASQDRDSELFDAPQKIRS